METLSCKHIKNLQQYVILDTKHERTKHWLHLLQYVLVPLHPGSLLQPWVEEDFQIF
jgi:hypothetical protein